MKIFIVLLAVSSWSFAAGFPDKTGYLIDGRGNVVRNSYGECWRTGCWTPEMAIAECDPDLIKKGGETPVEKTPPAPVIRAEPAAVPGIPIRFDAETLFDFDKADVRPEGQKLLDEKIVAGIKLRSETVMVTGHADRIGTEKYNQDLSERRAYAVRNYLQQQGIAAQRIRASGKGESEPDQQANTASSCKGLRGEKLISCLQPDRRVTVESVAQ